MSGYRELSRETLSRIEHLIASRLDEYSRLDDIAHTIREDRKANHARCGASGTKGLREELARLGSWKIDDEFRLQYSSRPVGEEAAFPGSSQRTFHILIHSFNHTLAMTLT